MDAATPAVGSPYFAEGSNLRLFNPMAHTHGSHAHGCSDHARHIAEAEARCADAGETLTPLRRRVLELLLDHTGPAKAYDLLADLGSGQGPAKPPTVYRALEFLTRLGLAHRIETLNA